MIHGLKDDKLKEREKDLLRTSDGWDLNSKMSLSPDLVERKKIQSDDNKFILKNKTS
eukprot:CAMPEP_0116988778 /NCGR_PEP_ID=MMETSP0467-20121206/64381_1 /TAXON_ID=283647 /ORGANISM="Mesodinium pulex, Strain SPMC105" /LENGTH=56 /DNA_ID=CAMNT_0004685007 /DNA_START=1190 /DNA_END=1360 /DNA_ORIENTATION=+